MKHDIMTDKELREKTLSTLKRIERLVLSFIAPRHTREDVYKRLIDTANTFGNNGESDILTLGFIGYLVLIVIVLLCIF